MARGACLFLDDTHLSLTHHPLNTPTTHNGSLQEGNKRQLVNSKRTTTTTTHFFLHACWTSTWPCRHRPCRRLFPPQVAISHLKWTTVPTATTRRGEGSSQEYKTAQQDSTAASRHFEGARLFVLSFLIVMAETRLISHLHLFQPLLFLSQNPGYHGRRGTKDENCR